MFSNPETLWIEILAIVAILAFIGAILGRYIYKKVHHMPTGECSCCKHGSSSLVKDYHKHYPKQ